VTQSSKDAPEFRMSAFTAVIGLRRYLHDHPGISADEAAQSLKRSDADFAAADFEHGLKIHSLLPDAINFADARIGIRQSLSVLIEAYSPWWCRFFPYGRQRLATALTTDEFQTFRSAGLFEDQPSVDVVAWWDAHAAQARLEDAERRTNQGRYAEALSLSYERVRLEAAGIGASPKWIALDDNSAGFDIHSYEQSPFGPKNLLIEVKSSQRNPPRIILTRGEWNAAQRFGDAYLFHIWKLPSEELTIMTVAQMSTHIPSDSGAGLWAEVEIEL